MASDGKVVISTELDNRKIPSGVAQMRGQLGGLKTVAKKLGGTIAAAFSVKIIASFAKECLDLGSDLQEVQNVVDVTFSTMSEYVNNFAKNAAQTAGMSETMAKRYTGTFGAMAKSFKFTESEAYEMSTSLTQLAGDVASFYNISQDAAYTKLKSVFTGETESLKDLGVVMTQTALDSYALEKGLGKTTQKMTEQEKVALRYQFVMDQLSGASGDFLRTSDSWANQTRLLNLQFDQLKATVGQGLINALTPAIKLLNTLLQKLQKVADAFKKLTEAFSSGGKSIGDAYQEAADGAGNLAENTEKAGKAAKRALAGFDELNIMQSNDDSSASDGSGGIGFGSFATGQITIGADVQDNVSPVIDGIVQKVMSLIEPLKSIDFSGAIESFGGLGSSIFTFGSIITDNLEWAWFNILVPLAQWTISDAVPAAVDTLTEAFSALSSAIRPVSDGVKNLWPSLKPVIDWIKNDVIYVLQKWRDAFAKVGQVFEEKGPKIKAIFSGIGEIVQDVWKVVKPILSAFQEYWGFVFDYIGNITSNKIGFIIDLLDGFVEFYAGVFTRDWKRALNGLIDIINSMISGAIGRINALINAINTVSFTVPDWVPSIGGQQFGFNIPNIKDPQIPHLAQGAVLPANKPFLAMVSDQRHGTNIEAPLSTIQEAVAMVMEDYAASNLAGHEATVEVLREILQAVLGIQIGDEVIGQAYERYRRKMSVVTGGYYG